MFGQIFGILLIIFLATIIVLVIVTDIKESSRNRKRFNDCKCPNCDNWLEYKGETDLKDRVYKCPNCGHTVRIGMHSTIDIRYCNINDTLIYTKSCQYCKSKQYCMYYKKDE